MEYLFFVVCLMAAATDFLWRRIPNLWLGSWFLTGLLLAGAGMLPVSGTEGSLLEPAACLLSGWQAKAAVGYLGRAAAVALILKPAWRLRMIGAGDVKLSSIMAAFLGLRAFAQCICYSLCIGGILSFFYMVRTHSLWQRIYGFLVWLRRCISEKRWFLYRKEGDMDGTVPFAPLLLAGYLFWWLASGK